MLPFPYREMNASGFKFSRRKRLPFFAVNALTFILTLVIINTPHHLVAALIFEGPYCGTSWFDAANNCHQHCPTGEDSECQDTLGLEYGCYIFTGCDDELNEATEVQDEWEEDTSAIVSNSNNKNNNFCGKSWIHAMLQCSDPCPLGSECSNPTERCFAATNCDHPLESLFTTFVCTLKGMNIAVVMDNTEADVFVQTLNEVMKVEEVGLALAGIDLGSQGLVEGLGLDIDVVVTVDYRPPPYIDLNVVLENAIKRNEARLVSALRERGERAGYSDFFNRVDGIEYYSDDGVHDDDGVDNDDGVNDNDGDDDDDNNAPTATTTVTTTDFTTNATEAISTTLGNSVTTTSSTTSSTDAHRTTMLGDLTTTTYFPTNTTEATPVASPDAPTVTTTSSRANATDATLTTTSDEPTVTTMSSRANATDVTLITTSDAPTAEPSTPSSSEPSTEISAAFMTKNVVAFVSAGLLGGMQMI